MLNIDCHVILCRCRYMLSTTISALVPMHRLHLTFMSPEVMMNCVTNHALCVWCCAIIIPTEARPDRFDSRLKNKFFYAMQGGKDLVQRKFADLSQHLRVFVSYFVTLLTSWSSLHLVFQGDSEEITQKIQSLRSHVILLLNIPR